MTAAPRRTGRRILLKLSGELLSSPEPEAKGFGVEPSAAAALAKTLSEALEASPDTQLAVVLGGGNYLRGAQLAGTSEAIDRVSGDHMGMLATIMNALGLRSALEARGRAGRIFSAVPVGAIAEVFDRRRAIEALDRGEVVFFAGGTGHPFFTTDTTASLRALEISADFMAKGTKVRGVFSSDPSSDPQAEFYPRLSYDEMLARRLRVMDATATSLCMDQGLPIMVFNMWEDGNITRVLAGEAVGTLIGPA